MWFLACATAVASPYWTAAPASTLAKDDGEFAAGFGYAAVLAPYFGQPVVTAWGRWAASDRWEVIGGAFVPIGPTFLVVHGTGRYAVAGGGGQDGPAMTVGLGVGAPLDAVQAFSITVPITVGFREDGVQGWVGGSGSVFPAIVNGSVGVDAGLAVDVQSFPVFLALGADLGAFTAVTAMVGVGYGLHR